MDVFFTECTFWYNILELQFVKIKNVCKIHLINTKVVNTHCYFNSKDDVCLYCFMNAVNKPYHILFLRQFLLSWHVDTL